ncbi:MAG: CU044_2847 family protein [Rhodospirillaceae bacterium]
MTSRADHEVTIILGPQAIGSEWADTAGMTPGEERHSRTMGTIKRSLDEIVQEVEVVAAQAAAIVESATRAMATKADVSEVRLGLALSAEGSVGFASAGASASVEIVFRPK